jgi:acyl-coenzyme A thioesterase PaaI-like protein
MQANNGLSRMVARASRLPPGLRNYVLSRLFGRVVPFLGTAGLRFEEVGSERLAVSIRNRRKVQNHIHGVHAAAMALLAETASGFVMGMNVPDDKLMLLKSMKVDYLQRSQGDMRAVATLRPEQIEALLREEKGNTVVDVRVTDASGAAPVACEMTWAWVPKKRPGETRQ